MRTSILKHFTHTQISTSTVNAYINTKAFHTHSNKHKYYKCIHQYQHDNQKSTSTVMTINQKSTSTVMTINQKSTSTVMTDTKAQIL